MIFFIILFAFDFGESSMNFISPLFFFFHFSSCRGTSFGISRFKVFLLTLYVVDENNEGKKILISIQKYFIYK